MMLSPVRTSAETDKLDEAMAKAQAQVINPTKNATAEVKAKDGSGKKLYEYQYAPLDVVLQAARPVFGGAGIAVYQLPSLQDGNVVLTTRFAFQGQWIEADYPVASASAAHQVLGSALTYARRYSYLSLANIMPDNEDDDGATAGAHASNGKGAPSETGERMAAGKPPPAKAEPRKNSSQSKKDGDWEYLTGGMKAQRSEEELHAWAADQKNQSLIARQPPKHKEQLREFYAGELERVRKADAERALDGTFNPQTGELYSDDDADAREDDFPGDRPSGYARASGR